MNVNENQLANGLGWFSIGLGLAEVLAPKQVAEAVGLNNHRTLLRTFGMREIASGVGILSQPRPAGWLWSRVAGDVMDLSVLGSALAKHPANRQRLLTAMAAVAGVTVLDILCSVQQSQKQQQAVRKAERRPPRRTEVKKSITINRPIEEIYAFWRDFQNLPHFMNHLKSVTVADDRRSHWVAKGPAGTEVEWDAEIIEEKPNELIAWRSLPGATVSNAGVVRFEPATGGRGTILRVTMRYHPPGGAVGVAVATLLGESPAKQINVDLHRIKQLLETGEIARTEGQPAGRGQSTSPVYDDFIRT